MVLAFTETGVKVGAMINEFKIFPLGIIVPGITFPF
jgi:hypothetical protein